MSDKFNPFEVIHLDYSLSNVLGFEGILSNNEFSHVTNGLVDVFPDLVMPLSIYFKGPYVHLAIARSFIWTARESFSLEKNGFIEIPDVTMKLSLENDLRVLSSVTDSVSEDLVSFYDGVVNFVSNYVEYMEKTKQVRLKKLVSENVDEYFDFKKKCPYDCEFHSSSKDFLRSDSLMSKLFNKVSSPNDLKDLSDRSWNLFVSLLDFFPEQGFDGYALRLFDHRSSVKKLNNGVSLDDLIPFYVDFVSSPKINRGDLSVSLNYFKEQHHDAWLNLKLSKYF